MPGPNGLHTGQIEVIGKDILCRRTRWLGVFARDKIPNLDGERRPFALVFNSDPADQPGRHWLAIYGAESTKSIEFFDSFGLPPSIYNLDSDFPIRSSSRSIQPLGSNVCGHYCLLFLYYRSCSRSFESVIKILQSSYKDPAKVSQTIAALSQFVSHCYSQCCTGQTCSNKCTDNYL